MSPGTATNGAANAGVGPGARRIDLPIGAGLLRRRAALAALLDHVRGRGFAGARLHGHAAPAGAYRADVLHAAFAGAGLLLAMAGAAPALGVLLLALLSSVLHALNFPSAAVLLSRRVSWVLVLRGATPATRAVVAASLDRVRPTPALPWMTLGACGIALLASTGGLAVQGVGVGMLAGIAAVALWRGRGFRPELDAPEGAAARALLLFAESQPPDTVVLLLGTGAVDGAGFTAFADWYALSPEHVEVRLVPAPGGAAATLSRAGWRVSSFPIDALRSSI